MVKLIGPAMGTKASGTVAGLLTYSNSRGSPYLKIHRKPKQPRSGEQKSLRAMMGFLSSDWTTISAADKATWQTVASRTNVSPFNAYQSENLKRWRMQKAPSVAYPAAEDDLQAFAPVCTAFGFTRYAIVNTVYSTSARQNWGALIFHSTSGSPAATYSNLIAIKICRAWPWDPYTHSGLAPGTHYYKFYFFSLHGYSDSTATSASSCVVT